MKVEDAGERKQARAAGRLKAQTSRRVDDSISLGTPFRHPRRFIKVHLDHLFMSALASLEQVVARLNHRPKTDRSVSAVVGAFLARLERELLSYLASR